MTQTELLDVLITSACIVLIILSLGMIPGGRGYGIAWGVHREPFPVAEAMLRDPYPSAVADGMECVGEDFERVAQ